MATDTGRFGYLVELIFKDEERTMRYMCYLFIFWAASLVFTLQSLTAPYGRYARAGWGFSVPGKLAWFVQELPAFVVPLLVANYSDCPMSGNNLNRFALGLYLLHYAQRTFLFPLLIRGGKPTPLVPFVVALIFCTMNGYLQGGYLLKFAHLDNTPLYQWRIAAGTVIFFLGMGINMYSDHLLRNLRKPGDTGYKIPTGGLFDYVSGANFLGEMLEWWGFALINWSLPTATFAFFTTANIGPRALHHHKWYHEKFDDYPKSRKALIPFIL